MNRQQGVFGAHGMVATSQPLASQTGLEILQEGGTALDAAIAANAVLGLVEPQSCGIGGDLFAMVWDAGTRALYGLNASGRSPQGLSYAGLSARLQAAGQSKIPMEGLLAVSVPGAVDGWFALHGRFGSMPMASLLQPAIDYAEQGFTLTPVIAQEWQQFSSRQAQSSAGDFQAVYLPGGKTPGNGELFSNPQLARAYRLLAEAGRASFYRGEIAGMIAAFMAEQGGFISRADLAAQHAEWVTPVSVKYRGYAVYELPPNGQGLAVLQMLKLMQGFDPGSINTNAPGSEFIHRMIEIKKLVFEDRARFYADPDFSTLPINALLAEDYCAARAALIGERAARQVSAGDPLLQGGDTVYLTTADSAGNMVSLIQSIYYPFGAGVVVPGTGFALQNRGALFSLDPAHPNVYAPGKRPFQTIIPAFIMQDGRPYMSFGVMGGDMQPQGQVQVITRLLDLNMDIQAAGDAPRWRHDGSTRPTDAIGSSLADGGTLFLEPGFPENLARELSRRGHSIAEAKDCMGFGGYQAIRCDAGGGYLGASDSRKDGCALGY